MRRNRHELDYHDSPWEASYFEVLPAKTQFDFGGLAAAGALAGGAGSLLGSLFGGGDAGKAASAQRDADMNAMMMQMAMYQLARQDLMPWMQAGQKTIPMIAGLMGVPGYNRLDPTATLRATPGYNFAMAQGRNALDRSAAARGNLFSGAQNQALTKFGQGIADQTYNNYLDRLFGISSSGQNAATQTGSMGMQTAGRMGDYSVMMGNALGQGYYDKFNQRSSMYDNLGKLGGGLAGLYKWWGGGSPSGGGYNMTGSPESWSNYLNWGEW